MTTAKINVGCNQAASDKSCLDILTELYQAYLQLIAGSRVQRVQTADFRTVDYTPGNIPALMTHYNTLWDTCGAGSGLPRLVAAGANATVRGGPAGSAC